MTAFAVAAGIAVGVFVTLAARWPSRRVRLVAPIVAAFALFGSFALPPSQTTAFVVALVSALVLSPAVLWIMRRRRERAEGENA